MTPVQALQAIEPEEGAPYDVWEKVATVRQQIRQNTAAMGVNNLTRVKAEFAKTLDSIGVGSFVIVCVEVPKKKHSPSHGKYVYLR